MRISSLIDFLMTGGNDMKEKKIILASKSPRRKELLSEMGITFDIYSKEIEEHLDPDVEPARAVEKLAEEKAQAVFDECLDAIVIGADTVVCVDHEILGKPKDREDARRMLEKLSGSTHQVIGGVALLSKEKRIVFSCVTTVHFYELSEEQILAYIDSNEPMDKAGAYGIQGLGKQFVEGIEGDYFNVVGLPVSRVLRALKEFG